MELTKYNSRIILKIGLFESFIFKRETPFQILVNVT